MTLPVKQSRQTVRGAEAMIIDPAIQMVKAESSKPPFRLFAVLKGLCMTAGGHYVVVPAEKENRFRKELRDLGYILK